MPAAQTIENPAAEHGAATGGPAAEDAAGLPSVVTELSAEDVVKRLDVASRRGRLAGFERGAGDVLFTVAAHGHPFDGVVSARYVAAGAGGRLTFETRMLRKLPVIFAVVLVATVWPGVHFMDQLIPGEWGWIPTWWWYIPVTALPIPFAWRKLMARSRASIAEAAREAVGKVAIEIGGRVEA
jgi:hypothetical protein